MKGGHGADEVKASDLMMSMIRGQEGDHEIRHMIDDRDRKGLVLKEIESTANQDAPKYKHEEFLENENQAIKNLMQGLAGKRDSANEERVH